MVTIYEPVLYVDVDDTLVSWDYQMLPSDQPCMEFYDPDKGYPHYLKVIQPTIDAMKSHRIRGHSIVVWSAGGAEWAREVVAKLGLEYMVDACIAKPSFFLDDKPASYFMPEHNRRDLGKESK